MLWTIMPEDTVLDGFDRQRDYQYRHYMGKHVMIESQEKGMGTIVQLLSTDPNDFLNENFSPGKEIVPGKFPDQY